MSRFTSSLNIRLFFFLGSSCGTIRAALSVHVRTVFSSSGIGLDNFKLSREQHVSRHAPSIGKAFLLPYFCDSNHFYFRWIQKAFS
jgi:hypothetical protein